MGGQTLVGVLIESYPSSHGNCFDVLAEDNGYYKILNVYAENLEHLIATKVIKFPIRIHILNQHCAVIADPRIPDEYYNKEFCTTCTPFSLLPLPQQLRKQLRFDRGEFKVSGNLEIYEAKAQPEKLSTGWTISEETLEPTEHNDDAVGIIIETLVSKFESGQENDCGLMYADYVPISRNIKEFDK